MKTAGAKKVLARTSHAGRPIREAEFAKRLQGACDAHVHAPPLHRGRLVWLQRELASKFDEKVSIETCRKWFAGEAKPKREKLTKIAQLLQVDEVWLSMGVDPDLSVRERKARNAMVDGVVNVVAGFIQMDGGHPAFPDSDDKRAERDNVDVYAIIKGASYAFHITLGDVNGRILKFTLPANFEDVVILGTTRDDFSLKIYEILPDVVNQYGERRGGSIHLEVDMSMLKRVDSFKNRL